MPLVEVNLGERSYPVIVAPGALAEVPAQLALLGLSPVTLLVTNPRVFRLYGAKLKVLLAEAGYEVFPAIIPDSERAKSLGTVKKLYDLAVDACADRRSGVIALGGGVVGDTAGFFAATYMRGVPFIPLPTTLLAQVDSSIGGKVAVNHPKGKNLIGAFYQPKLVIADPQTLKTLPEKEFRTGLAEVIKAAVIWDAEFFRFLEEKMGALLARDQEVLTLVIARAAAIKAAVVSRDEREEGLRAILNFGHTIGHALETLTSYRGFSHGEAVAIGMVLEARLAVKEGLLAAEEAARIEGLLKRAGLPTSFPAGMKKEEVLAALSHDKKTVARRLTFALPKKIGEAAIYRDPNPANLLSLLP